MKLGFEGTRINFQPANDLVFLEMKNTLYWPLNVRLILKIQIIIDYNWKRTLKIKFLLFGSVSRLPTKKLIEGVLSQRRIFSQGIWTPESIHTKEEWSEPQEGWKPRHLHRVLSELFWNIPYHALLPNSHYLNRQNICWNPLGHKTHVATPLPPLWPCDGKLKEGCCPRLREHPRPSQVFKHSSHSALADSVSIFECQLWLLTLSMTQTFNFPEETSHYPVVSRGKQLEDFLVFFHSEFAWAGKCRGYLNTLAWRASPQICVVFILDD